MASLGESGSAVSIVHRKTQTILNYLKDLEFIQRKKTGIRVT